MWASSGLNNQPWRFVLVTDKEVRQKLAKQTKYHSIIEQAPACIAVFFDKEAMYHELKDHLAMGACIENILLAAHALGLGVVWLGEILKDGSSVRRTRWKSWRSWHWAIPRNRSGHRIGEIFLRSC